MTKRTLNGLSGFSLFCSGAWMAHVSDFGSHNREGWIATLLGPAYSHPLVVYFALMILAIFLKVAALIIEADTKKKHLQKLLDGFVAEIMNTPDTFGAQDYRVTLFRFRKFCLQASFKKWFHRREFRPPWGGWLVPYVRSGGEPLSRGTFFEAPTLTRQGQESGHGVAGTAWVLGEARASGLPKITSVSGSNSKKKYCREAFIDGAELEARLDQKKSLALSLWAERLSTTTKPKWGVLIYDSIDSGPIIDDSNEAAHKLGMQALALVLEERPL